MAGDEWPHDDVLHGLLSESRTSFSAVVKSLEEQKGVLLLGIAWLLQLLDWGRELLQEVVDNLVVVVSEAERSVVFPWLWSVLERGTLERVLLEGLLGGLDIILVLKLEDGTTVELNDVDDVLEVVEELLDLLWVLVIAPQFVDWLFLGWGLALSGLGWSRSLGGISLLSWLPLAVSLSDDLALGAPWSERISS